MDHDMSLYAAIWTYIRLDAIRVSPGTNWSVLAKLRCGILYWWKFPQALAHHFSVTATLLDLG